MTQLENRVVLKPDKNRAKLESLTSTKMREGIVEPSLRIEEGCWQKRKPKIMLIVPPYARIKKSLDVIAENISYKVQNDSNRRFCESLIAQLRKEGIEYLEEMKRAGVPMGLLRIGTAAKKAGYDVKILDGVFEGWNNERHMFDSSEGDTIFSYGLSFAEIERKIREYGPDVIGITCSYTHQWGNARAVADLVKKIDRKIPIIMGGVHVTGLPGDALLDCPSDYAIIRQADFSFVNLLDFITRRDGTKQDVSEVAGIAFKKDGKAWQTFPRPYMKGIDFIAIPDLSLVNLSLYDGEFHSAGRRRNLDGHLLYGFTSIGCNTGCNFCAIPTSQGGFRKMNEQKFDEYLRYIAGEGVKEFLVEDDHLMHDPEWARYVFRKMKEYGLPWVEEGGVGLFNLIALLPEVDESFVRESAVNHKIFDNTLQAKRRGLTTEQLIEEMALNGCYSLYLAVESANKESLEHAHKPKLNSAEEYTRKIVKMLDRRGIRVTCGFMLGFIEQNERGLSVESRACIMNTIRYGRMLKEAGASFINPFIVTPLPGAPNFRGLEKSLGNFLLRNTDLGYSHEFSTVDAPNGVWTRDEMNLLRVYSLIYGNSMKNYKEMLKTGTWPVN